MSCDTRLDWHFDILGLDVALDFFDCLVGSRILEGLHFARLLGSFGMMLDRRVDFLIARQLDSCFVLC
jgi:hypothetical protein